MNPTFSELMGVFFEELGYDPLNPGERGSERLTFREFRKEIYRAAMLMEDITANQYKS